MRIITGRGREALAPIPKIPILSEVVPSMGAAKGGVGIGGNHGSSSKGATSELTTRGSPVPWKARQRPKPTRANHTVPRSISITLFPGRPRRFLKILGPRGSTANLAESKRDAALCLRALGAPLGRHRLKSAGELLSLHFCGGRPLHSGGF